MKTNTKIGLVLLVLATALATVSLAQSTIHAKVVPFKIAGATDTYVTCVNDSNDIAGYFYNGTVDRGFIYFASSADTVIVNYPGAQNTRIYGINNSRTVVGSYNTTGSIADDNGFKYNHATLTYEVNTNWLAHTYKVSRDINDAGCIVGDHRTNPTTSVGHIMCGGNNTLFHYNYYSSFVRGMNNAGSAVGFWMDAPYNYGFIRNISGTLTDLNYPGATRTRLSGINDSNMVVGVYDLTNSFIYHNGVFKKFVKSGTTDFQVQDINNYGFIVGYYKNAANQYEGFYMPYCDIGFRPNPDGWQFSNSRANMWPQCWWQQFDYSSDPYRYGQAPFPTLLINGQNHIVKSWLFPDWKLFVETFGENQCYGVTNNIPIIKNAVFNKWYDVANNWGGSCNGFTQSAFMVWNDIQEFKWHYPGVGPWGINNSLYELPLNYHSRNCINELQVRQRQKYFIRHINQHLAKTPNQTLTDLKISLLDGSKDEKGLLIYNQNGGGAHIVCPYKIEIDTINPDFEYIFVYDCNQPGDTSRHITVDKSKNAWYYFLSINSGVGQNQWGGDHAHKGLFLYPPASIFYQTVFVDSIKKSGFADNQKNNTLQITNSTSSNIIIQNQSSLVTSFVNNILLNEIPGATPIFLFMGNEPPHGFMLPDDTYAIEMKDFSDSIVRLSYDRDENQYYYSRGNATLAQKDKFLINTDGIKFINFDNISKNINVQSISDDSGNEKTFFLYQMPHHSNSTLNFSILNNDKLKIVNEGGATKYNLKIQLISSTNTGIFEHDSILMDANTTHIINVNWPNIQNADVCIYIDNGNNGMNDDTLCFANNGIPVIATNPTLIQLNATTQTDTIFVGNTGSGSMSWSASSDSPTWLSITGSHTGTDFGFIKYTATANSGAERTGLITFTATAASNSPYVIEVKQAGVLSAPQNLTASDGTFSDGVHVSWDVAAGATYYKLYRSSIAGHNGVPITGWISATSYIDNTADGGDFYYYSVKAAQSMSGLNETGFSNIDDGWRACFTANFSHSGTCLGQPTVFTNLSSVHTNAHYLWDIDNNGTIDYTTESISHVFTTTGAKTVVLTVTDSSLCNSTYQQTINILPFPAVNLPADTVMCAGQAITLNAGTGFTSYLWSTGGTSASETVDSTGFGLGCAPVYVSVTSSNGCAAIDTVLITWTVCADITVPDDASLRWQIYPNPANEQLSVALEGFLRNVQIVVYNFKGQVVYSEIVPEVSGLYTHRIDMSRFAGGVYLVKCQTDHVIEVKKLIVY